MSTKKMLAISGLTCAAALTASCAVTTRPLPPAPKDPVAINLELQKLTLSVRELGARVLSIDKNVVRYGVGKLTDGQCIPPDPGPMTQPQMLANGLRALQALDELRLGGGNALIVVVPCKPMN